MLPFTQPGYFLPPTAEHRQRWPCVPGLRGIKEDDRGLKPFKTTTATTTSIYLYFGYLQSVEGAGIFFF